MKTCKYHHDYYRKQKQNYCPYCGEMLRYRGIVVRLFPKFTRAWNGVLDSIIDIKR